MSAVGTAIKLAERNGISIPEFIKFLASPAGYTIAKALDAIETQAKLPQGILGLAQNPSGAVANYLQTQAENVLFNENNTSKIENIVSELQGTNPDKPNYVGPQQVDSTLSQANTAMLPYDLGVQPTGEFARSNNINDELREGMFGTITPNFPSFVGPQELNSPADQIDTQFLAEDLGVKPTSIASNTSNSTNNSSIPLEILQTIGGNVEGKSLQEDMNNISNAFGNTFPASLGLTETQSMPDYSRAYAALGGAESVSNLRDQFLNMGLDENTIGSVFSNYYAPEIGNDGMKSIVSESGYRNGGFIYRGGR